MGKIEVSKSCQSCVHGNFKTGYSGKRKTGWCMLYTSPSVIPELSDLENILYNEAKDNKKLMPFSKFKEAIEEKKNKYPTHHFYYSNFGESRIRKIWEQFEENYLWWEANREKLKKVHILNYCCDHKLAKNARSPAKGYAKNDGEIKWN